MAVNKDNVKVLKLMNGMELLCEMNEDDFYSESKCGFIDVKNPIQVLLLPNKTANDNSVSVAFAPFAGIADRNVELFPISRSQILTYYKPTKDFIDQYAATFSSLLVPDSPSLIVP